MIRETDNCSHHIKWLTLSACAVVVAVAYSWDIIVGGGVCLFQLAKPEVHCLRSFSSGLHDTVSEGQWVFATLKMMSWQFHTALL